MYNGVMFFVLWFQMSSGLRERLKRSGRCYKSPSITPKRPLVKQIFTSPLLASPQSSIENAEHHRGSLACSSNETPTGKERSHGSSSRSKKCIDSSNPDSLRTMLYNRYGEEDSDHNDTLSMKSKELASSEQSTIEAKKKNSHCGESEPYTESQVSSQKLAFTNCEGEGKTFLPSPSCEKRNTGAKRQRSSSGEENQETVSLDRRKADLQQKITEKEEILRKLTMVKLYRTKVRTKAAGLMNSPAPSSDYTFSFRFWLKIKFVLKDLFITKDILFTSYFH